MQKPRRFNHSPIYMDPHRDRLAEIEQRARRELGLDANDEPRLTSLKGCFTKNRRDRRSFALSGLTIVLMLALIMLIFIIWKILL